MSKRKSVRLAAEVLESRDTPTTFTVTNSNDSGSGSLRDAITQATADGGADTIVFSPTITGTTVFLTTEGDTTYGPAAFLIKTPITIQGTGETIEREPPFVPGVPTAPDMRLFSVAGSGSLTLDNLTLSNGAARGTGSAFTGSDGIGGAIYNTGQLTLNGCTLTNNSALGGAATGDVNPPTGNTGGGGGGFTSGGQASNNPSAMTVDFQNAATMSPNAGYTGGGGSTRYATPADGSNLNDLPGGDGWGGAVFNFGGSLTVVNSTFTGNSAVGGEGNLSAVGTGFGGAILNLDGSATLVNDTLVGDTVGGTPAGGEVENLSLAISLGGSTPATTATLTIANTILDNSSAVSDLTNQQTDGTATVNATGPNIVEFAAQNLGGTVSGTAFTTTNPDLGALGYNFGPTETMVPKTGSPAIDAGSNAAASAAGLTTDQRFTDFLRVYNGTVDIGAVEVQPNPPSPPTYYTVPPPPVPLTNPKLSPIAVSGQSDGSAQLYSPGAGGIYNSTPTATLQPFGPIGTDVRVATADVNGDGTPDTIFATGPGVPFQVAVVSGADNSTFLVQPFFPFESSFTGGGFVSAGYFLGNGRADIVVSPDEGGGPRVSVYALASSGNLVTIANFFGIADPNFRGGARTAVGDVNDDGVPDLIVAAGTGGGPRVTVFNGKTIENSSPTVMADFFAFPDDAATLRNGVYVAAGDVNGDGHADLIFGGGPGGAPRVLILSGLLVAQGNLQGAQDAPIDNFFAGSSLDRGGIRVAAVNADGDDLADLMVGSGQGDMANVVGYLGTSLVTGTPTVTSFLNAFGGATLSDGVYVG
ncbi:beta strand repeat-containing protein [Fimbriiglobus ruber]|uniref:Ribose ABC transport system, periplasmic ribose-binding protein RbsB n=1 Tax=Fimbriiglobus ruber TaxID=1908690 RepID=A0A225DGE8_9BACT|nr:VCBS repeat-containing protein [Fimbriiglobus ruber]OWK40610.1 Ribose ABC transport system, periplasmic ribose-binding protein RbsB [Fimbriiglobus ruber]